MMRQPSRASLGVADFEAPRTSSGNVASSSSQASSSQGPRLAPIKRRNSKAKVPVDPRIENERGFCIWAHERLAGDAESKQVVIDALAGHVVTMAFHPWGCRVIQYALDAGNDESRLKIADEFRGHVVDACFSMSANFVMSKIVAVLPLPRSEWIFEELRGAAVRVARNNCGCRVLSRLFAREHIWQDSASAAEGVISSVLESAAELCYHPFGQHVIEAAFVHGAEWHRQRVLAALHGRCARMAKNRHASHMVQKALLVCRPSERVEIAKEVLGSYRTLMRLCQDNFGHHIVRTALAVPCQVSAQAARHIKDARGDLEKSTSGRKLLGEITSITSVFAQV